MFTGVKINNYGLWYGALSLAAASYYFGKKGASIPKAILLSSLIGVGGLLLGQQIGNSMPPKNQPESKK